ncbi:class GN sortase [Veronia nyctiphanis]|uniref:Class GN sortase n=1 Tax=Veronia nyctiphanis TaxID=1278244 RepID=A0A4V1LT37_9GAMM|nr:class GN sortase [Veronia nyctiphanis]RXJ73838.1 class GN sortase [Veronia nyctiphanis]
MTRNLFCYLNQYDDKAWWNCTLSSLSAGLLLAAVIFSTQAAWIKGKAWFAQYLIEDVWITQQHTGERVAPWPWADTYPAARLLLPGQNPLYVLAGVSGRNLAFGPTLQLFTAQPGEHGNIVVYGHNDTHFASLEKLKPGQIIRLENASGETVFYRVSLSEVISEHDTEWVTENSDDVLTLVTCYPFSSATFNGPERYVVVADRV